MNKLGGGRSFVKKLKKGNVILSNREVYLRDDLVCGYPLCTECVSNTESKEKFTLDPQVCFQIIVSHF